MGNCDTFIKTEKGKWNKCKFEIISVYTVKNVW